MRFCTYSCRHVWKLESRTELTWTHPVLCKSIVKGVRVNIKMRWVTYIVQDNPSWKVLPYIKSEFFTNCRGAKKLVVIMMWCAIVWSPFSRLKWIAQGKIPLVHSNWPMDLKSLGYWLECTSRHFKSIKSLTAGSFIVLTKHSFFRMHSGHHCHQVKT